MSVADERVEITSTERGFVVHACGRPVVRMERQGFTLAALAENGARASFTLGTAFPGLARWTAAAIAAAGGENQGEQSQQVHRLAWRITLPLAQEIERLRGGLGPMVLEAQNAIRGIARRDSTLLTDEVLWTDRHLIRDIGAYRAAAIAAAFVEEPGMFPPIRQDPLRDGNPLELLRDWRGLYSPDGKPYRSLNRTLMNLPRRVDPRLVPLLRLIRLPRPLTDPLELRFVLLHTRRFTMRRGRALAPKHQNVILHATADEIRATLQRYHRHVGDELRSERDADLETLLSYLSDYPHEHHGRLGGLLAATMRWHREQEEALQVAELRGTLESCGGADARTAVPPIPLPDFAGVKFLLTVGEIVEEGRTMHHCVASHAQEAVAGDLYVFHVHFAAKHATVALTVHGEVLDARGPRNQRNTASEWGAAYLSQWGNRLRRVHAEQTADRRDARGTRVVRIPMFLDPSRVAICRIP